jgi:hypothetical protein
VLSQRRRRRRSGPAVAAEVEDEVATIGDGSTARTTLESYDKLWNGLFRPIG